MPKSVYASTCTVQHAPFFSHGFTFWLGYATNESMESTWESFQSELWRKGKAESLTGLRSRVGQPHAHNWNGAATSPCRPSSVPRSALVSSVSRRAYLYAPSLTSRIPLPLLRRFFLLRPLLSLPCREREGENSERPSSERENRRWGTSAVAPGRLMWPRISGHLAQVRRAGLKNPFLLVFLL